MSEETPVALTGAAIVTPGAVVEDHALLIARGCISGLVPVTALPVNCERIILDGGVVMPGFIDIQVNGGGGLLLNDAPTVEVMAGIAHAHRRFGTTGLLPTLISDDLPVVEAAMAASDTAMARRVPGVLGLHIEGPFLNPAKRGIHDAGKFRRLDDDMLALLSRPRRGVRLVTLAPELAAAGSIARLAESGVIICAGHSMADYAQTRTALAEGLHGFTHLFNAMTAMGSREPGMVGAAIEDRNSRFGLIADGHHVHPATMRIAIRARGTDGVMLVTDAMPPVGGSGGGFSLFGQDIHIEDGVCKGPDGTLAGSALTMAQAVRNAVDWFDVDLVTVSQMASGNAAAFLRIEDRTGAIRPGLAADLVHLDADMRVRRSWIGGELAELGEV